ncbi:MAG: polymerase sigma factor RpoD, partial [Pseudomonadota bacterium]
MPAPKPKKPVKAQVKSGAAKSVKPIAKVAAKPAAKSNAKPVAKSAPAKATKPAVKAAPKASPVKAKASAKPAPKVTAKPVVKTPVKAVAKPVAKPAAKAAAPAKKVSAVPVSKKEAPAKAVVKASNKVAKPEPQKASAKESTKANAKAELKVAEAKSSKADVSKPAKTTPPAPDLKTAGAKRGRKPKAGASAPVDEDLSDIEDDLAGEPVAESTEKAKPLRMKISKAKERALMKEFGLDETVLSEEDMAKRRQRLKALIKLGKTRGYLTHGEISDHLPDKLVDAETLEVVIATLNDLGVAVYEQTPDAETLIITDNAPTGSTEEEAEEAAEAALSTVDSEFGRTTDPVRMYMREMGTVELLTREGEIE